MEQLGELRHLLDSHDFDDVKILAVSRDGPEASKRLIRELTDGSGGFPFPLLSDRDLSVIRRYGILNPDSGRLPHPATFVIDKQGIVQWRFVEVDYRERASNEQILEALGRL